MSLVYLLTSLPALELGESPPMSLTEFAVTARTHLVGSARREIEQALLLDEIERTAHFRNRVMLNLPADDQDHAIEDLTRERAHLADTHGHLMPPWALKQRPLHLLLRYWFQKAYRFSHAPFMREYIRMWLNLEEMIAGCLCKQENMERAAFMSHMEGGFDSTWKVMVQSYDQPDLGLGNRLRNFNYVREICQLADVAEMERRFDQLRWALIERCLGPDPFTVDQVLAYFFRLRLVTRVAARDETRGMEILDAILTHDGETKP